MHRTSKKITRTLGPALVVAALFAPNAGAAYHDLRSPEAHDAAQASKTTQNQGLRSPDALDAARSMPPDQIAAVSRALRSTSQDRRSPHARDAGRVVSDPSLRPTPTGGSIGTDWGEVGIVAGGVVLLIGLAGLIVMTRRRGTVREARGHVASS